eukprot:COSAG04_NODE_345_length_16159_cov_5.383126_14_plen_1155_part_01
MPVVLASVFEAPNGSAALILANHGNASVSYAGTAETSDGKTVEINAVTMPPTSARAILLATDAKSNEAPRLKTDDRESLIAVTRRQEHCDLSTFDASIRDLERSCCRADTNTTQGSLPEAGDPCAHVADTCDHVCAAALQPLFASCHDYLAASLDSSLMGSLSDMHTKCADDFGQPTYVSPAAAAEQFAAARAAAADDPSAPVASVVSQLSVAVEIETITDADAVRKEFEDGFKEALASVLGDGRTVRTEDIVIDEVLQATPADPFASRDSSAVVVRFHIDVPYELKATMIALLESLKLSGERPKAAVGDTVALFDVTSLMQPIWISMTGPQCECSASSSEDRKQPSPDSEPPTSHGSSPRRMQESPGELVDLGDGAAAFCTPAPTCAEYAPDQLASPGALVLSGCHSEGNLGDRCTLTCQEGYQESASGPRAGTCTLSPDGASASYIGQTIMCEPETLPDGSFSPAYCAVEAPEVVATCCDGIEGPCDAETLPSTCSIPCAEAWLPLWENCRDSLAQLGPLTSMCEAVAEDFLSAAPSTITVSGFTCHPYAEGLYVLDEQTVGAKQAWHVAGGGQEAHLFFRDSPDRWCFGDNTRDCFAQFETFEDLPQWQESVWSEECSHAEQDSSLLLDPGYTHNDCERALHLVQEEVHSRCCTDEAECINGAPPSRCEYDCAHIWYPFSQDCADFLSSDYPDTFTSFTAECDRTHDQMQVLFQRGRVAEGQSAWNTTFTALRDVEYKVEMVPDDAEALRRSELQVIAPHSHHVMASRFDASTRGSGRKMLVWAANQDEAGVEIACQALEGAGDFELRVTIVGTIEHLAPEAITCDSDHCHTSIDASVAIECQWDDDCVYRYQGQELRGSGSRFQLRLHGVAGLTYKFSTELIERTGVHMNVGIYHESALGGSDSSEAIEDAEFALGRWTDRGAQTYADLYQCQDTSADGFHVPCEGDALACDGDMRCMDEGDFVTHPSQSFPAGHEFEWPCAATGTYFVEFRANCDVPFYADTSRCDTSRGQNEDWRCDNEEDSRCSSQARLRIDVVDDSTTVAEQTTIAVTPGVLIPGSEAQAEFARLFSQSNHPAISYITEILPVGRGTCRAHPCQNGGDCVDMPLSTVDGVPNSPTYRCECPPSWVGLNCDETLEEQAELGALFDFDR